jgi:hypothetical protein
VRVIKLSICEGCPHLDDDGDPICLNDKSPLEDGHYPYLDDFPKIPDWCPLESWNEK